MNLILKKNFLLILAVIALAISVPITLYSLQQKQNNRSKAAASTTLSFAPISPITTTSGSNFDLDIMIDPGTNYVTYLRYHVTFDPTVVQLADTPFTPNPTTFPVNLEGPYIASGSVIQALSIGNDPTKTITKPTKVGTLHFKAINPTGTLSTQISFGNKTYVLSSSPNDQASENVLSTTTPAQVIVSGTTSLSATPTIETPTITASPTAISTVTPTNEITPTTGIGGGPTATPAASPTNTLTIVPTQSDIAQLNLNIFLHGIGYSGDNINPTGSAMSNKNPTHPTQNIRVKFYNESNVLSAITNGQITYSSESGSFKGTISIPTTVSPGNYTLKVKTNQHLTRRIAGIINIQQGQTIVLPLSTLTTGDANDDNMISILDYNILVDCYSDLTAAVACTEEKKPMADFNDDGQVNSTDYNLFLRELSQQSGD